MSTELFNVEIKNYPQQRCLCPNHNNRAYNS